MLATQHNLFKHFWYPVAPIVNLQNGPAEFTLLNQNLVVWQDSLGNLAAMDNKCCHRSAKLSLGTIVENCIQCAYHGWRYNTSGEVVHIPQLSDKKPSSSYRVNSYPVKACYGYAWVCLDKPLTNIPIIEEAHGNEFRLIPEFFETWNCAGLRVMENELDLAHPAFVHTETFGSEQHLVPSEMQIEEFDFGLHLFATLGVVNTDLQMKNLNMQTNETTRHLKMTWFMPFTCKLDIHYPNGLRHIIVNTMTPINDHQSQMVQFCLRNDGENDVSASDVIAFDRQVTLEDKKILESTDPNVPLNHLHEKQLFTDKPGIIMRKQILNLIEKYETLEFSAA